ncbi:unnamed protein product [Protopolystoma xenopodis]|uniref:Uncharacterized protein n=1 Tax=Protopolystoma xenopodis TaxID=117903 RepID=A0A448XRS4_9PLAT|nr:unnamed protein product [Protopolystoma xenopodis]
MVAASKASSPTNRHILATRSSSNSFHRLLGANAFPRLGL